MAFCSSTYLHELKESGVSRRTQQAAIRDRARLVALQKNHPEMRITTMNFDQRVVDCEPHSHISCRFSDRLAMKPYKTAEANNNNNIATPFDLIILDYFGFRYFMRPAYESFFKSMVPTLVREGYITHGKTRIVMPTLAELQSSSEGTLRRHRITFTSQYDTVPSDHPLVCATQDVPEDILAGFTNATELAHFGRHPFVTFWF